MNHAPVQAGDILAGKYRVEKILGAGTMGVVLAATQIALDRRVALKFMTGAAVGRQEHEARFLREARAASKLQSQHAAKVLDVGTLEGGAPYIVMEFLDGKDLAAVLRERGPLPVEEAVSYILQACEAVAEAHAAGIIHRDIKPANLFLTKGADRAPCVKLVDFGVAKLEDSTLDLTGTAQALGSPLYMSPESLNAAKDVDGQSDIWALGVTLFELLAQVTPFQAPTLMALCTRVWMRDPDPIERYRTDVPPGLAAVIMQCFEKDRARRWPSVAAFAAALAPYASVRPASYAERVVQVQRADLLPARPTDLLPPEHAPVVERTAPAIAGSVPAAEPALRRAMVRRSIAVLAGAFLVVLAGVVLFILYATRGRAQGMAIPTAAVDISTPSVAAPPPTVTLSAATTTAEPLPATATARPVQAPRARPPSSVGRGPASTPPPPTWEGPRH